MGDIKMEIWVNSAVILLLEASIWEEINDQQRDLS